MGTKNDPGEFDCYENAEPDEPMFVLLARDPLAPELVREWARAYVKRKAKTIKMSSPDWEPVKRKAEEARACAEWMEQWREKRNTPRPFETSAGDLQSSTRRLVHLLETARALQGASPYDDDALELAKEMASAAGRDG